MRNFITVSSLLLLIACSGETKRSSETGESDQKGPESLLLPEHRDTTTRYSPLPDSAFQDISFSQYKTINGKNYKRISFTHLAKVKVNERFYHEDIGQFITVVEFGKEVASLDSQRVTLKGYLLPVSHTKNFFFLSAHPYSRCFFCNQAGIESIMELKLDKKVPGEMKMDQIVVVTGWLELSGSDPYKLPYTLHDARIVEYF